MEVGDLTLDPNLSKASLEHGLDLRIQFGNGDRAAFIFLEEGSEQGIIHSMGKFSTTAELFFIAVNASLVGFRSVGFVIREELTDGVLGPNKDLLRSFVNAYRCHSAG